MIISDLSVVVSPADGDAFRAVVRELTNDAIDVMEEYIIEVSEDAAVDAFPGAGLYSAMMAWAAREAARRSGYTGRLVGAYAGHDFVFVAIDERG